MSPSSGKIRNWKPGVLGIWFCLLFGLICGEDIVYTVPEDTEPPHLIGNIANDTNILEEIRNDPNIVLVTYSFLQNGNPYSSYFHIYANTSDLFLTQKLDRESITSCEFKDTCSLILDVTAQSLDKSYFRRIKVTIIVGDVNDNEPVFTKNFTTIHVSEDSDINASWPIVGAVDADLGANSIQNYRIFPNDTPFRVNVNTLVDGRSDVSLVLRQTLDRESVDKYLFYILAEDGGDPVKTGTLTVNIVVIDVNDNAPRFNQSSFNVTLPEGLPEGSIILNMSATDSDEGENGRISFRLSPYQSEEIKSTFAISETYGNLSITKTLVYEPGEIYTVRVDAIDHAQQPKMSQATVFVSVMDSTNDPPIINVNLFSGAEVAHIYEHSRLGSAIAHVVVTDDDMGRNGIINCSIISDSFRLDPQDVNEFKVAVNKNLDREIRDEYSVSIICQDSGIPPSMSSVQFNVSVLDTNDNEPKFTQVSYTVSIPENNQIETSLLEVSANDIDLGSNAEVTYSLQNTGIFNFTINQSTGIIYTNTKFDRENCSEIHFTVVCTDKGSPSKSSSANVTIHVLDVNDNRPLFEDSIYTFTIPENQNNGSFVGFVNASDADEGDNAEIRYFLSSDVAKLPFSVTDDGMIVTAEVLDREEFPHGFNFKVIAYDLGKPQSQNSTSHVNVFILDLNDNDPKLKFPNPTNFTVTVLFDIPVGSVIGRILATDIDYDLNSKLTFSIDDNDLFRVNENNGDIILTQALTPADVNRYPLTVAVRDRGTPKRTVNGSLVIIVTSHLLSTLPQEDHPKDTYMLLAVIICCVTIVLAGVIILAIFLIRRHDRIKLLRSNKPPAESKYDPGDEKDLYDALEKASENFENNVEKQKHLSLNSSPNTSQEHLLVDKTSVRSSVSEDEVEKILERISSPSSFHSRSSLSASESSSRYIQQVHSSRSPSVSSSYQNPQSRMSYASNNGSDHNFPQRPEREIVRHQQIRDSKRDRQTKPRDNDSETSMESNTSDSGRGGSDCDMQSSGGMSVHTETEHTGPHIRDNNKFRSKQDDQRIELQKLRPQCHQYCNNRPNYPVKENHDVYSESKNRNNRVPRTTKQNHASREYQYDYQKHKPSVHWNPVTRVINGNLATIEDYDDASTTTSGSYTVDDSGNEHCAMTDSVV